MIVCGGCDQGTSVSGNTHPFLVEEKSTGADISTEEMYEKSENSSTETNSSENISEEEEVHEKMITLVMVGDILLHTPVSESGKMPDGSYQYDHLFTHVKEIVANADIAIANEEVILGGSELGLSGYPCFNGAYEVGDALGNSGFDVILHATNHALDKGEKGIRNCMNFWKTSHPDILVTGINDSMEKQQNQIPIIERNHIKIAILNYTYGTNGIEMPKDAPYLVNLIDREKIGEDVEKAKQQADFIIVCPHWGIEYQHAESKEQEELAKYLADIGVNLVIGTHPHVIQPMKWVEGKNGNKMLVYYSLGNFVNATSGTGDGVADRMLGEIATVTIVQKEEEICIDSYGAIPIVSHLKSGIQGITVYPLDEYTEELEVENEISKQDSSFSIEYLQDIWKTVNE